MSGISNTFIETFLANKVTNFDGVFSADNIPKTIASKTYFIIICNQENEGEEGTHFVTIIGFPDYAIYLDSFGLPCKILRINQFLNSLDRPIYYNDRQIQSHLSNFCGFYCIMYTLYFDKKINGDKVENIFFDSVNLMNNDNSCLNEIKKLSRSSKQIYFNSRSNVLTQ